MRKNFVLFIFTILPILVWLTIPSTVLAQAPATLYVDTSYTGSESGTPTQPYNTIAEGIASAQSYPGGGYIFLKEGNNWVYYGFVNPVMPGAVGGGEITAVVPDMPTDLPLTNTLTSLAVTDTPSSLPVTQTLTSLSVTETPTSLPVTDTASSPRVTDTPASPNMSEPPPVKAAVYGLLAILTAGLVLAVYWYLRGFRRP